MIEEKGWGVCLSMRSFCQWVHYNCITHFGVIVEPLQMIALAHLFIQLASGGAKGQQCNMNVEKLHAAASENYENTYEHTMNI